MAPELAPRVFPIARGSSSTYWFCAVITALFMSLPLILLGLSFWPAATTIRLSQSELSIDRSIYGRTIPASELRVSEARRLTVEDTAFRPVRRTNGVGLPGYQAGWFDLRNGEKALLFVNDWTNALMIPTSEGYKLIVTPQDPEGLLTALRAFTHPKSTDTASALPDKTFALTRAYPASGELLWTLALTAIVPLFIAILLCSLARASRRVTFEIGQSGLRIRGDLYGRVISRATLEVKVARIINMKEESACRWMIRTNGVGMPGYGSGWFRLKGGIKALLFVTDTSRVVSIPTSSGYTLMLSPADPESFLQAIQVN
jgi:hypothetical protein